MNYTVQEKHLWQFLFLFSQVKQMVAEQDQKLADYPVIVSIDFGT